jgi:hypothetical protein
VSKETATHHVVLGPAVIAVNADVDRLRVAQWEHSSRQEAFDNGRLDILRSAR